MKHRISALFLGTALAFATGGGALAQDKTVKVGVLTDNSGLYSDLGGAGSTLAVAGSLVCSAAGSLIYDRCSTSATSVGVRICSKTSTDSLGEVRRSVVG